MRALDPSRLLLAWVCLLLLGKSHQAGAAGRLFPVNQAQATTSSEELSAERPKKPPGLTFEQRADVSMARKAYAEAVDYYRRALKQVNDADASLWNKLGIAYQQQLDYRQARKAYNQAVRRRRDFAEAWNNLGTTYFLANSFKKAIRYYARAIELNPNSAPFHLNLGTAYYRRKKYAEAVEEFRVALMLDPNALTSESRVGVVVKTRDADVEYYFYMAKVFASLGRVEEAVRYLRRAFEDGFKDFRRVEEDSDFKKISEHAAFIELMKNPPRPPR